MVEPKVQLSCEEEIVRLPGAGFPIGVTVAPETERGKGRSCVRFMLQGDNAMGAEPFNKLALWHEEDKTITLLVDDLTPVEGCRLRECSLDMSEKRLYITLYTQYSAQDVRSWFGV